MINNETQNCLFRYSHKRKQHTNQAGGKRTNIWNKGKRCGQHRYQSRIRNAEDRKCEKDHCAEDQHLDALAGKELCIGVVRQFCNVADVLCRWLLEVSAQKTTALSAKLTAAQHRNTGHQAQGINRLFFQPWKDACEPPCNAKLWDAEYERQQQS